MTKHESACAAYVQANFEIGRLTRLIGIQINYCRETKAKAAGEEPEYSAIPHCLPDYYRDRNAMLNVGWMACDEVAPLDCPFCLEADRLIQQRKKARQTLGAAKRQITVLGKQALKEKQS